MSYYVMRFDDGYATMECEDDDPILEVIRNEGVKPLKCTKEQFEELNSLGQKSAAEEARNG